jgi:O-antigen/teichoic acid export membrane protein
LTGSDSTLRRVAPAMAWNVAGRILRFVLGLGISMLLFRGLGEFDFGLLSMVRTALAFTTLLCSLGFGQALLKFLPTFRVAGTEGSSAWILRRALLFQTLAWGILVGLFFLARPLLASLTESRVLPLFGLGLALSLAEVYFLLLFNALSAWMDVRRLNVVLVLAQVTYMGMLVLVLVRDWGVAGVLVAGGVNHLWIAIALWDRVRKVLRERGGERDASVDGKRVLRYAFPFVLIGLLNLVVWRQSEVILLGYFMTPREAGFFEIGYKLPQTVLEFIPGTIWPLIMAAFSEAYAKDRKLITRGIETYYKLLFLLALPLSLGGFVLGDRIVTLAYTTKAAAAAGLCRGFFLVFAFSFFTAPLSMALYAAEKSRLNLGVYAVMAVVNVGLDLLLIPRWGLIGAFVPVSLAVLLSPLLYYPLVRREGIDVRIPFAFVGRCFLGALPVLLVLPLKFLVPVAGFRAGILPLLALVALGGALVMGGYRVTRVVGREEEELVRALPLPGIELFLAIVRRKNHAE